MFQEEIRDDSETISVIIFQIGWEQFALELLDAKEIIQSGQVRRLPKSLDFIEGIYNYRGDIIHCINLKKKLNLNEYILYKSENSTISEESPSDESTSDENTSDESISEEEKDKTNGSVHNFIIIVNIDKTNFGFFVDRIISVAHVKIKDVVRLSPIFQTSIGVRFIKGIIKFKDRPRILLDLSKVLSDTEQKLIKTEMSV